MNLLSVNPERLNKKLLDIADLQEFSIKFRLNEQQTAKKLGLPNHDLLTLTRAAVTHPEHVALALVYRAYKTIHRLRPTTDGFQPMPKVLALAQVFQTELLDSRVIIEPNEHEPELPHPTEESP